jgi:uncharacterized protein YdiU (UPF0061 family)
MTAQGETVEFSAFDNSYARLPDRFFERLQPTPVAPRLVRLNVKLALDLGLDPEKLAAPEGVEILAGNRVPKGGEPLAMAYAGLIRVSRTTCFLGVPFSRIRRRIWRHSRRITA